MMRAAGPGLLVVVLSLGLGGVASAQGLGDTAARERERRAKEQEKEKKPEHVYTNDDLEKGRPPGEKTSDSGSTAGTASSGSSTSSESSSEDSSGPPPLPDMAGANRPYIEAVRAAQQQVSAIERQIQEANAKLNPMSGDYIYGPSGSNDANDELRVRQELSDLQQRLVHARQDLAAANQALSNARQGRPAGSSEGE
jgi:hypothetical protein